MSKEQPSHIVYISGRFLDRQDDISYAFDHHRVVQLRAKDSFIELAIQLAEHFAKKGWASYEAFRSSLTTDQEGSSIPQVLIRLARQATNHSQKATERPREEAKDSESRKHQGQRKEYRQRQGESSKNYKQSEYRQKDSRPKNNRNQDDEW